MDMHYVEPHTWRVKVYTGVCIDPGPIQESDRTVMNWSILGGFQGDQSGFWLQNLELEMTSLIPSST